MANTQIAVTIAPESLLNQTTKEQLIRFQASFDIIELRIDQWEESFTPQLIKTLEALHALELNKQILVTYRTLSQGGSGNLDEDEYMELMTEIIQLDFVDMIDVEFDKSKSHDPLKALIAQANHKDIEVVLSYHDFQETPSLEELKHLYFKMHQLAPAYLKVAVMPNDKLDVIHLLEALAITAEHVPQKAIGIAMSHLGIVSRTAQGLFGGSVSYGCLDEPKAPGQIHAERLKQLLEVYE